MTAAARVGLGLRPDASLRARLVARRCRFGLAGVILFGVVGHVLYLACRCPIDLSGDEAHYWDWSRRLDWSYYSKGPLVAWLIRASCVAFGHDTMLAVRLPAIVLAAGTLVLTYLLTRKLFASERLALGAVLLLHAVPLFVAGSILMTIDPPFLFCWALATYLAAVALFDGKPAAWVGVALAAGAGTLAKYSMLLWFPPVLLFLAADPASRRHLRSPWPWIALAVALLFLTPIIVWNVRHEWVSLRHVATQTGVDSTGRFGLKNVGPLLLGQAGVVGPGMCVIGSAAFLYAVRPWGAAGGAEAHSRQMRFLAWIGAGFFAFTLLASLRTKVQPNWPAPAYFTLLILTAYFLSTRLRDPLLWRGWRWWFYPSVACGIVMIFLAHYSELAYPALKLFHASDRRTARLDFTAKLKGWSQLGDYLSDHIGEMGEGAFVLCDDYQQTAEAAFYMRGQPRTYYAGSYYRADPKRLSQYDLWPDRSLAAPNPRIGRNAIFVGHVERPTGDLRGAFDRVDDRATQLHVVREGTTVRTFYVLRCYGFKGMPRQLAGRTY